MRALILPLHPEYHLSAEALILANAPERCECAKSWPRKLTDRASDGYVRRDYVAVDVNDPKLVIGYAAIWPQGEGRFRMDLIVAQDRRRRGVGSSLFRTLHETLRVQNATIVQARAFDNHSESLEFLKNRDFTETNRMIHQRLSVATASAAGPSTLTACLGVHGIYVTTLDQEQACTPDWLPKILELLRATGPERVGNPYRVGADTEFWTKEGVAALWESSHPLSSDAVFFARHNEQYLGVSFLARADAAKQVVAQGETAVHIGWRRRGIATLLKLHVIRYAQIHGYAEISTRTASPGMLALNERLGFHQDGAEVRMVKVIEVR